MDRKGSEVAPRLEVALSATTSELFPPVYERLSELAGIYLRRIRPPLPLAPRGLVHEAFIRIAGRRDWNDCAHLLGVAARAMRDVLVDHVRRRAAARRGGGWRQRPLDGRPLSVHQRAEEVDAHELVEWLAGVNCRAAQVVRLRFLDGLTISEAATVLRVSHATIENDWKAARVQLRRHLFEPLDGQMC